MQHNLNIELNHRTKAFGPSEELEYAIDQLHEAVEAGSLDLAEERWTSGKVETDNYVIEILPKNE